MYLGKATAPEGLRLYAIGDIHGCDDQLAAMHVGIVADLAARPAADHRIIHLGDYIDRGRDSAGVVERLASLSTSDPRVICLRGNHDQMLIDFLDDPVRNGGVWMDNGGAETLRSYGVARLLFGAIPRALPSLAADLASVMPEKHKAFLRDLVYQVRFDDFVFVHAGIRPGIPLERQNPDDLIWIRDPFLFDPRDHGFVVIHGHTPVDRVDIQPSRIDIDTGAVYGGTLSCLVLEGTDYRLL